MSYSPVWAHEGSTCLPCFIQINSLINKLNHFKRQEVESPEIISKMRKDVKFQDYDIRKTYCLFMGPILENVTLPTHILL